MGVSGRSTEDRAMQEYCSQLEGQLRGMEGRLNQFQKKVEERIRLSTSVNTNLQVKVLRTQSANANLQFEVMELQRTQRECKRLEMELRNFVDVHVRQQGLKNQALHVLIGDLEEKLVVLQKNLEIAKESPEEDLPQEFENLLEHIITNGKIRKDKGQEKHEDLIDEDVVDNEPEEFDISTPRESHENSTEADDPYSVWFNDENQELEEIRMDKGPENHEDLVDDSGVLRRKIILPLTAAVKGGKDALCNLNRFYAVATCGWTIPAVVLTSAASKFVEEFQNQR